MRWMTLLPLALAASASLAGCGDSASERSTEPSSAARSRERQAFVYWVQSTIGDIDERVPIIQESLFAVDQETRETIFLELNEILQLRQTLEQNLRDLPATPPQRSEALEAEMQALIEDIETRFEDIHALLGPHAFPPPSEPAASP